MRLAGLPTLQSLLRVPSRVDEKNDFKGEIPKATDPGLDSGFGPNAKE